MKASHLLLALSLALAGTTFIPSAAADHDFCGQWVCCNPPGSSGGGGAVGLVVGIAHDAVLTTCVQLDYVPNHVGRVVDIVECVLYGTCSA